MTEGVFDRLVDDRVIQVPGPRFLAVVADGAIAESLGHAGIQSFCHPVGYQMGSELRTVGRSTPVRHDAYDVSIALLEREAVLVVAVAVSVKAPGGRSTTCLDDGLHFTGLQFSSRSTEEVTVRPIVFWASWAPA